MGSLLLRCGAGPPAWAPEPRPAYVARVRGAARRGPVSLGCGALRRQGDLNVTARHERPPAMDPQEEARTSRDPLERSPGVPKSQTPDEEERRAGGTAPAAAVLDAEADGASVDGLWELPVEPAKRRPECSRCR